MSDLDRLPWSGGEPPSYAGAEGRRCSHHYVRWAYVNVETGQTETRRVCDHCGRLRDEAVARRNRGNRTRGDRHELAVARTYGGRKIGKLGGAVDIEGTWAKAQVKSHAGSVPDRLAIPFAKLEAVSDGRVPVLIERWTRQGADPVDFVVLRGADFRDLLGELDK